MNDNFYKKYTSFTVKVYFHFTYRKTQEKSWKSCVKSANSAKRKV